MISNHLRDVILRTLGIEAYPLEDDTLASEVPGWDSLTHVRILAAVEAEFAIRIKGLEAIRLKSSAFSIA